MECQILYNADEIRQTVEIFGVTQDRQIQSLEMQTRSLQTVP